MTAPTAAKPAPDAVRQRPFRLKVASWLRWLHIYLSMFTFMLVLFFSVTGITLNHPTWFFDTNAKPVDRSGKVPAAWVAGSGEKVARLEIVEYLRKNGARGALDEFRVDEAECLVSFKAPGYSADSFIDRTTGAYRLTIVEEGSVAVLNDLHKGRHSGGAWAWVIDVSAAFLVLVSLSGMGLIFYLKRLRTAGLLTALAGIVAFFLGIRFLVP